MLLTRAQWFRLSRRQWPRLRSYCCGEKTLAEPREGRKRRAEEPRPGSGSRGGATSRLGRSGGGSYASGLYRPEALPEAAQKDAAGGSCFALLQVSLRAGGGVVSPTRSHLAVAGRAGTEGSFRREGRRAAAGLVL